MQEAKTPEAAHQIAKKYEAQLGKTEAHTTHKLMQKMPKDKHLMWSKQHREHADNAKKQNNHEVAEKHGNLKYLAMSRFAESMVSRSPHP